MTAIAAAAAVPSSVSPVASAAAPAVTAAATTSPASTASAPHPAVTVSISANAASAAAVPSSTPTVQPLTISATPDQVSTALQAVNEVNSDIWFYNHTDWNVVYESGGEQAIKNSLESFSKEISTAVGEANEKAGDIGVPVMSHITGLTNPTSGNAATSSAQIITGSLTLAPFNFSSGGSTYAVTTNTAGQLVGTKDGQAWQTWGIPANDIPSTTDELVALLASFKVKDAAANSSAESANTATARVNISV